MNAVVYNGELQFDSHLESNFLFLTIGYHGVEYSKIEIRKTIRKTKLLKRAILGSYK